MPSPTRLLAADLPYRSYETVEDAVKNAKALVAAGAEAVKAEGGRNILPQVKAIIAAGIPFLGHLGMLPQHVLEEGGYHIKGKQESERTDLLADAESVGRCGRVRDRARTRHRHSRRGDYGSNSDSNNRHRFRPQL